MLVRTSGDPMALAPVLRRDIARASPGFHVQDVGLQAALVRRQMVRERLLATLSLFFAGVAVLLSGIGLYGVLNHAVIQQRREIGLRMALGAGPAHVVRRIVLDLLRLVCAGAVLGLAGGMAFGQLAESLLFQVSASDPAAIMTPHVALGVTGALAALIPAARAVRIDPVQTLRSE